MGAIKTGWNVLKGIYNYTPQAFKSSVKGNALTKAAVKKLGAKGVRYAKGGAAVATGLGAMLGDSGPDEDETTQRAMNQLRYGADMTDDQLQEAIKSGKTFQDTGLVGENGLNEEQVKEYIASQADQRGSLEKWGGRAMDALSFINPVATIGGAIYDNKLGDARNQNLTNIVEKLKADANEGKIRKNMEGSLGKFMSEGLLNKDFGRGNVRQSSGGIKPPVDAKAQQEEADALKEYEAVKAKEGVFAAIAHPSAMKAGRTVYQDVLEASGGDKNTAEALLSGAGGQAGAGLTDEATSAKYYGDPKANELANKTREAANAQSRVEAANTAAAAAYANSNEARSGPIEPKVATTADQVVQNQDLIAAQSGYLGESPKAREMRAYFEDRGVMTDRGQNKALANWDGTKFNAARKEAIAKYQANRARLADIEYADKIVKPGDPDYKLGPQASKGPTDAAMAEYMDATAQGGGAVPSVPAQVNASAATPQPSVAAPSRAAILTQGRPGPAMAPEQSTNPGTTMSPTPNGIGTGNRGSGMPDFRMPDIGTPGRAIGSAAGDMLFSQDGTGVPLPGGAKLRAPVMGMSPYGIGNSTPGSQGIPQVPDIGAPARSAGEKIGSLIFPQNQPGVQLTPAQKGIAPTPQAPAYDAKGNLTDPNIAKMLAEQKRKEIEARNRANPQRSTIPRPDPAGRFIR